MQDLSFLNWPHWLPAWDILLGMCRQLRHVHVQYSGGTGGQPVSWPPPGHSQASVGIQRADKLAQKLMPDLDARAQGVVLRDLQRGAV